MNQLEYELQEAIKGCGKIAGELADLIDNAYRTVQRDSCYRDREDVCEGLDVALDYVLAGLQELNTIEFD